MGWNGAMAGANVSGVFSCSLYARAISDETLTGFMREKKN